MSENKPKRLSSIARDLNVATTTIIRFLEKSGLTVDNNPNSKIPAEWVEKLEQRYGDSKAIKDKAIENTEKAKETKEQTLNLEKQAKERSERKAERAERKERAAQAAKPVEKPVAAQPADLTPPPAADEPEPVAPPADTTPEVVPPAEVPPAIDTTPNDTPIAEPDDNKGPNVLGKIDLDKINQKTRPKRKTKAEKESERKQKKAAEAKKSTAETEADATPIPANETENTAATTVAAPADVAPESDQPDANAVAPDDNAKDVAKPAENPDNFIETKVTKLTGPNVIGKIDINPYLKRQEESEKKKIQAKEERQKTRDKEKEEKKSKRKRIQKVKVNIENTDRFADKKKKLAKKPFPGKGKHHDVDEDDVQKQIKETLARLTTAKSKSKSSKHRKEKREIESKRRFEESEKLEAEKSILKVTEFVSVNELATMMDIPVTKLIGTCMSLGLFVSINQRLDAETMSIVAEEYGFSIEFVSAEVLNQIAEEEDKEEDLQPRPPIVTVMGHVDHGKTKLLDYIRHTNVVAGEAGGITQHIGAYSVCLDDGRHITFLDTPGHEAFTAMRARGAQITDVAIIIIAADDNIMPQTVEAINHASAAGVPIVFAINKIDKPTAHPEKVKEALAKMNYLVEDWGGKYQSQEISAKAGINISELLEKVLLEAELLDLKANPNKRAVGTVLESSLDKGRGYVATLLVQSGTLRVGDVVLAGCQTGRVKAMYNERGAKMQEATASTPVLILGLDGAPQAGDRFNVFESEHEARSLANKRIQLQREQNLRTQKHITLDEIGRRLALGNFHEINIIIKGDVDGSVEALSDSLIKLSTDAFNVNIIHKAVGQISESDVMLAVASEAIIVGFQVRPSGSARKLAEKEEIEIRLYSVIYDAINEIKDAMEGMLSPILKENITGSCEIKEIYKISHVGSVAGCMVTDGKIFKTSKVRIIRDGIVIYTGVLGSLKRFKDDAKEVVAGLECGLNVDKFNDIKVGDIVEAFDEVEVKQTL